MLRGIPFARQQPIPLGYKGIKLDCGFRLDLHVARRVIVELKSVDALNPVHEAILLTYLRLSGCELGLLINFNVSVLKDGVRRFMMPRDVQRVPRGVEHGALTQNAQRTQRRDAENA